jgi:hypothetical protein
MKFKQKLASFMYGRNGSDQITTALIFVYIGLGIASIFTSKYVISPLMILVAAYMIFRMMSKNVYKRRAEAAKFTQIMSKVTHRFNFKLTKLKLKEIKTHRYKTCPHCKKTLRLPKKTGKHTVNCPCCNGKFEMRTWL